MTDAERIWLEPECCAEPGVGRTWCSVNEWACCPAGECDAPKPTEYVRADLVAAREAAAAAEVERLRKAGEAAFREGFQEGWEAGREEAALAAQGMRSVRAVNVVEAWRQSEARDALAGEDRGDEAG